MPCSGLVSILKFEVFCNKGLNSWIWEVGLQITGKSKEKHIVLKKSDPKFEDVGYTIWSPKLTRHAEMSCDTRVQVV